jgi:hypothetical protein
MIIAACVIFTAGLFLYIFSLPPQVDAGEEKTRLIFLRERKDTVYENLRDLNFEHKAGKLPDTDYEALRAGLEDDAATLLAEIDVLENQPPAIRPVVRSKTPKGAKA